MSDVAIKVTPEAFLTAAFSGLQENEKVFVCNGGSDVGFRPIRWRSDRPLDPYGLHYNCFTFETGAPRALARNITRAFVIMLDDVGNMPGKSKVPLERISGFSISPHALVVTRRSSEKVNCQAVWFIEPCDYRAATAFTKAALNAGLGDPNAGGAARWARPPGSIKRRSVGGDGFVAEVIGGHLNAPRVSLDALAEAFGVAEELGQERERLEGVPPAPFVRATLARIKNDLDREGWLRVGFALKGCVGPPPFYLSDVEAFRLFDVWSQHHPSYSLSNTERFWRSAQSNGSIGYGTLVWMSRRKLRAIVQVKRGELETVPASGEGELPCVTMET